MRIILEGPDGSGKSSLAKQLSIDLNMKTFWSAGPPGNIYKVKNCCNQQYDMQNHIFDRVTCISEQCYNIPISSIRKQLLNYHLMRMMEDSILIYCTALVEESDDGLRNEKHDKMVKDNFEEIKLRYKNIMFNIKHIKYNFQTMKYEDLLCMVKQKLQNIID
jgi:cytidylate kinase